MNKEITKAQLKAEERALKEMKKVFEKARTDVEHQISALSARKDLENVQSIIYQTKYQKAILEQINGVLDQLNSKQYTTLQEFMDDSYKNGYIGSMYDLKNQGIPITMPIDPKKMSTAITTDSKLSKEYYQNRILPENLATLKRHIRQEITRGIAGGKTWNEMAWQVAQGMNSPFNKALSDAMRIVRTEGHRINQQGFLDAAETAVKEGAEVVKQWDATLDGDTRPAHQLADGQIKEINDYFVVGGERMKAPGIGGSAKNVCNCRCQLLQRARWALDQDELDTLKARAEYFGLDKTKDFDEFKKKYLVLPDIGDIMKVTTEDYNEVAKIGGLSGYPKKYHQDILNYLNDAPDDCRKAWNTVCDDFHIISGAEYKRQTGRQARGAFYNSYVDAVYLNIKKASEGCSYETPFQVVFHEYGHHLDYILNRRYGDGNKLKSFTETYENGLFGKTIKKEAEKAISDYAKSKGLPMDTPVDRRVVEKAFCAQVKSDYTLMERADVSDMFEPIIMSTDYPFGCGHGRSYWKNRDNGKEGFAEMYSAKINNPESWKLMEKFFPESIKIFEDMLKVVD